MGIPKFRVDLDQDPNLTPEQLKSIGASGAAVESMYGISKPWDAQYTSETDLEVFDDLDEYLEYVEKAKAILDGYRDRIEATANIMAKRIESGGPRDYVFTEKDFKVL